MFGQFMISKLKFKSLIFQAEQGASRSPDLVPAH